MMPDRSLLFQKTPASPPVLLPLVQSSMEVRSMDYVKENAPGTVHYADAVLEGGGMRCIAHVGALCIAEARGYRWQHCAGTSAGALVAALLAAEVPAQCCQR